VVGSGLSPVNLGGVKTAISAGLISGSVLIVPPTTHGWLINVEIDALILFLKNTSAITASGLTLSNAILKVPKKPTLENLRQEINSRNCSAIDGLSDLRPRGRFVQNSATLCSETHTPQLQSDDADS